MARLTAREWTLAILSILYAAAAVPIGIHKGIDFEIHVRLAEGLLSGEPVYAEIPRVGQWWPPFAGVALVPFALVARASMPLAKGVFALVSVACVAWSVARFLRAGRPRLALAVAAVAVPLQINIDYLNINAVLLALVVAGAFDFADRRDVRAGVWLGLATALKVFPGLLLLYAAYRRRWRTAAYGASLAFGLTVCSLLPLGVSGALVSAQRWVDQTGAGAWVLHRRNQSLPALLSRAGVPHSGAIAANLLLLGFAAFALRRSTTDEDLVNDLGLVTLLAVLLSPIAWDHYFLLALPAWVAALARPLRDRAPGTRLLLIAAGVATSGVLTIPSAARGFLLEHSIFGWGTLVLLLVMLVERQRRSAREPQPVLSSS